MAFSGLTFLIRFLPPALLLYALTPKKLKNALLAVLSLIFYSWGNTAQLVVLLAVALVTWLGGIGMAKAKKPALQSACFYISLLAVLGSLAVYKYTAFVFENLGALGLSLPAVRLAAPVGISFYVFTAAGYLWDVRRKECEVCTNPIDLLLYLSFFPKVLMGPITRFGDMSAQLHERSFRAEGLEQGAVLFITGLAKKVLLADSISALWTEVNTLGFAAVSTPLAWLGVAAYAFQLYFDFSGYSDMARGLALFFGFTLPENFRTPYSSVSATEFWRRWHITMGGWFKQYVYFPLGGSRCSVPRSYLNMFAVWALTGLWHGADWNFILWGLFYFAILVLEKSFLLKYLEKYRLPARLYMVVVTAVGWAIFAVSDLGALGTLLGRMFLPAGGISALYYLKNYAVLLVLCALLCTATAADIWKKLMARKWLRVLLLAALLLISLAYITDATYSPFLYTQF